MIKYILGALLLASTAFAGDGHNHGDEGFAKAGKVAMRFELSEIQEHNLGLETQKVTEMAFYESLSVPAVVKKMSLDAGAPLVQGFVIEGIDFSEIKPNQTAQIKLDAFANKTFKGRVVSVEPMMDGRSRLYSFWVSPEKMPMRATGLKGSVTVQTGEAETALGLPESALIGDYGDKFVFVKKGSLVERRNVALGHQMGEFFEIVGGVEAGEEVVTQGAYQLQYVSGTAAEEDGE